MPVSVVILLVVVVIAAVVVARGRSGPPVVRAPSPRGLKTRRVVRFVAAGVGVVILATLSVASWWDIRTAYDSFDAQTPTIQLPTKSFEDIVAAHPEWANGEHTPQSARLLFHVMTVDASNLTPKITHVEQFEITWPKTPSIEKEINAPACRGTLSIGINHVEIDTRERSGAPVLRGNYDLKWESHRGGYQSGSGMLSQGNVRRMGTYARETSWSSLLSVVPSAGEKIGPYLLVWIHLVDAEDPLRPAAATELLDRASDREITLIPWSGLTLLDLDYGGGLPPAFVLIGRMGLAFPLVILAALLMARLFRRYAVGALVMLPVVILLVVCWDYAAMATHRARLTDEHAPLPTRRLAAMKTAETFFFADSAADALAKVAERPQTPPELTDMAWALSRSLTASQAPIPVTIRGSSGGGAWRTYKGSPSPPINWMVFRSAQSGPCLVVVSQPGDNLTMSDELAYVILAQEGTYRRIVTVDKQLTATVIGDERDFLEANRAIRGLDRNKPDIWQRLILPALTETTPDPPAD